MCQYNKSASLVNKFSGFFIAYLLLFQLFHFGSFKVLVKCFLFSLDITFLEHCICNMRLSDAVFCGGNDRICMSDEELKQRNLELERENAELRKANDILKDALVFFTRDRKK